MASGERIRWDSASADPKKRPLSPSFDTETGRGFSSGSVALQRPAERDYPELRLLNELTLRSQSGAIVYQGRARGIPAGDSISFDCDGWISHGESRQFTDLIIDRDASSWGPGNNLEKARLANYYGGGPILDASTESSSIRFEINTRMANNSNRTLVLAQYRSPGPIGRIRLGHQAIGGSPWILYVAAGRNITGDSDVASTSTSVNSAGELNLYPTAAAKFARIEWLYNATFVGDGNWSQTVTPTVYGTTGITTKTRSDGLDGFTASDGIKYLASRYCPKWSLDGVVDSGYLIPHAVWREPTTPTDAIRQLNSYHLWKLGVWEDRTLTFAPYDLTTADWQVRSGVDGVRVEYQGDTTENVYNGVAVSYSGFDGETYRVTPEDSELLRDSSEWISANEWGDEVWLNLDVSWPCSRDDAVAIGQIALANANQARRPSTITVPARLRDSHGILWPSSYVRADQTIVVSNQTPSIPRLITRTSWSDHSLTITTDNAIDTMEAFTQRLSGALSASGIV